MMSSAVDSPPIHSSPGPAPKRPRGILKNSFQRSPNSPGRALSSKEVTIANTNYNAGHHEPGAEGRPPRSRRQSERESSAEQEELSQRLKWDEANLYLTEQERTSTMKITEPKTPYARHYDPSEDASESDEPAEARTPGGDDGDYDGHEVHGRPRRRRGMDDIPDLSLGEPEEELRPSRRSTNEKSVHVDDSGSVHGDEEELIGLSPEEREKHRRFEEMRKKHYEMKDVAKLLGHAEGLPEDEEEDSGREPPVPRAPPNGAA